MSITQFTPPSAEQILQQLLNNYQAIATANGYNIAVNPGTEIWIRFNSIAQQQAVFYQIMTAQMDARMADTATGDDLDRVLNQYGLVRKPATSSEGFVQLIAQAPQSLTAGMILNGPNGLQYQVSVSGIYQNASSAAALANPNLSYVPVNSVSQGSNTDLGVDQVMTWLNINSLMQSTTPVVVALTGGSNAETDQQARFRLYQTIQNPPNAGNSQFLVNLASNIDPIVQSGFVYPNFNGAGTQLIALMGYQTDGYYIGRDIPHLLSDNAIGGVTPYNSFSQLFGTNLVNDTSAIYGQLPAIIANQYASVVTTVQNIPTAYIFGLNLPYPVGNPINGIGGGWVNNYNQTWPVPAIDNGQSFCPVVGPPNPATPTNFSVQAYSSIPHGVDPTYDPIPGLTAINWIDRSGGSNQGWLILQATVLSFTKSFAATNTANYNIVINTPFVCGVTQPEQTDFYGETQVTIGDVIFPASVNAQNYLNTVMNSYAGLGPGQVVAPTSLLIQLGAARTPSVGSIYSPVLGSQFLQALTSNNPEIYSAQKLFNSTDNPLSFNVPNNPNFANPPGIFIPEVIGFYDISRIPTS